MDRQIDERRPLTEARSLESITEEVTETAEIGRSRDAAQQPAARLGDREHPPRRGLLQMLSSRGALRRAIILSEVLGPPKALRKAERE